MIILLYEYNIFDKQYNIVYYMQQRNGNHTLIIILYS